MNYRILFLTESREDYLADSLLHGLISLGLEVVDYPRKEVLYTAHHFCPADPQVSLRGNGFTLYGLLPNRDADRSFVIQRLQAGYFDLVVIGQIWRQWGQLLDLAPLLQEVPIALLDGDDDSRLFHRSGTRLRRYGWQPFPIRSGRCFYLKRELQVVGDQNRLCRLVPASFSIPADKIRCIDLSCKQKLLALHCVDPDVADFYGLHTSYAFTSEDSYYEDLAASRYAVTTMRGGWDCLRHYEIAAAGALICFKNLDAKPPLSAPHQLQPGVNCLSYENLADLQEQMNRLDANPIQYQQMLLSSLDWVRRYTTTAAATRLLNTIFPE